jgi:hypothetical protein
MKNARYIVFISLFFFCCKQEINENDISKINGYWEIEKVILASGEKKEYKVNETIDYFEVKNKIGFRKKVTPQFDGKYLVNDLVENITISTKNSSCYINYKTKYQSWKEEIVALHDSIMVLKSKENVVYHYKKAILFSIK